MAAAGDTVSIPTSTSIVEGCVLLDQHGQIQSQVKQFDLLIRTRSEGDTLQQSRRRLSEGLSKNMMSEYRRRDSEMTNIRDVGCFSHTVYV